MSTKSGSKKKKIKEKVENKYIYQTKTIIDQKEFKKFQKFYLNKFKNSFIPKLIIVLLALAAITINFFRGNFDIVFLIIIFIIAYVIVFTLTINIQINKMYKSNRRINVLEETITFYDDYLESKSSHNYCRVEYKDIYRVCETKNNFYIFISDNQAFILIKKNIENVESFKSFIKDEKKVNYKVYR